MWAASLLKISSWNTLEQSMRKQQIARLVQAQVGDDMVDSLVESVPSDTAGRWISREDAAELVRITVRKCAEIVDEHDPDNAYCSPSEMLRGMFNVKASP
jgi:hypothetical protein